MRYYIFNATIWLSCACLAGFTGCQSEPTLSTEYVEGVVTIDGTPVEGATVAFRPVNEGQGMSASGFTDANGVYKLTAVGGTEAGEPAVDAGTLPGEYYVMVMKAEAEVGISEEEAEESGQKYSAPVGGKNPKMTYLVPKIYQNPRKSGLKATVKEGDNTIPLELKSR